jgi:DNA-binding response OmpR family regulator
MSTILIVEDDARMQKVLRRLFAAESFTVESATEGLAAMERFHLVSPSAVVLDLMLPGLPTHQEGIPAHAGDHPECNYRSRGQSIAA